MVLVEIQREHLLKELSSLREKLSIQDNGIIKLRMKLQNSDNTERSSFIQEGIDERLIKIHLLEKQIELISNIIIHNTTKFES